MPLPQARLRRGRGRSPGRECRPTYQKTAEIDEVGEMAKTVPDQRRAEVDPQRAARVRIGNDPVGQPRPAHVDQRERCPRTSRRTASWLRPSGSPTVRQLCRNRNRIAEISVPAWPMPIQNTKLVMSKAQPTVGSGPTCRCRSRSGRPPPPTPSSEQRERRQRNAAHHSAGRRRVQRRADVLGDIRRASCARRSAARRAASTSRQPCSAASASPAGPVAHDRQVARRPAARSVLRAPGSGGRSRRASSTRLCGSFRSPNTMAPAGHDCWQAVWIVAVGDRHAPAAAPRCCASWMRCTQKRALLHHARASAP